jgi:hypothetical protein
MAETSDLLNPADFENLPIHQIYAKFVKYGQVASWVSGKTLPAGETTSDPDEVRVLSRQKYGRLAGEVDLELSKAIAHTSYSPTFNPNGLGIIGRKKLNDMIIDSRFNYKNKREEPS